MLGALEVHCQQRRHGIQDFGHRGVKEEGYDYSEGREAHDRLHGNLWALLRQHSPSLRRRFDRGNLRDLDVLQVLPLCCREELSIVGTGNVLSLVQVYFLEVGKTLHAPLFFYFYFKESYVALRAYFFF